MRTRNVTLWRGRLPAGALREMTVPDMTVMVRLLRTAEAEAYLERSCRLLSAEERARADAFARTEPRLQFLMGRGLLRSLLAEELGQDPETISIGIDGLGKPWTAGIEFNLSHTNGLVGVAMSRCAAVGIDVERIDHSLEILDLARNAFTRADAEQIAAADEGEQSRLFYDLWTEREAVAKCLGRGITDPAAMRGEWKSEDVHIFPLALETPFHGSVAFRHRLPLGVDVAEVPLSWVFRDDR